MSRECDLCSGTGWEDDPNETHGGWPCDHDQTVPATARTPDMLYAEEYANSERDGTE